MRLLGCMLLLSGFVLSVLALVLLTSQVQRFVFVLAGLGVEVMGVWLLTRAHTALAKEQR